MWPISWNEKKKCSSPLLSSGPIPGRSSIRETIIAVSFFFEGGKKTTATAYAMPITATDKSITLRLCHGNDDNVCRKPGSVPSEEKIVYWKHFNGLNFN